MRNIKITYRYDGSMFYGSQRQPEKRTVQGEIEKLLNILLKEEINMVSSGRTDRGVHDFNNFRTSDCGSKTSIREIYSIELFEEDQKLIIEIRGNSFLKSQIRIMIGTCLLYTSDAADD